VAIAIDHIGICTSDIHVLHGAMRMPDGDMVGHEFTGTVDGSQMALRADYYRGVLGREGSISTRHWAQEHWL